MIADSSGTWLEAAIEATDAAVDELLTRFLRDPFEHRVEHSLHVQLYQLLIARPPLAGYVQIGDSGYRTRLVHKEWPGKTRHSDRSGRGRRVSYDLVVVDPTSVNEASLDEFEHGRLTPTVAIELGLDYSSRHLTGDLDKLATDQVERGYIVHFSRRRTRRRQDVEDLLLAAPDAVQTVFAHLDVRPDDPCFRYKSRTDRSVSDRDYVKPVTTTNTRRQTTP